MLPRLSFILIAQTEYVVDVLVSNAGICPFAEFLTMPHAVWERTRQVNLDGSFYVTQGRHASSLPDES